VKVLLDARAVTSPLHGIARYGWNLLRMYAALGPPHDFHVILRPGGLPETWEAPANFRVEQVDVAPYGVAEQVRMPRLLARARCDLLHTLTYTAPLRAPHPLILSLFDLIHLRYPREYTLLHPLYYRAVVRPLVRRARAVVTFSEASRRDISEKLGADPRKIRVIPLAADPRFRPPPPAALSRLETADDLEPGYLLHLSNYRGHKNAEGVVRAYARLRARAGVKVPLVLAGRPPTRFRRWLAEEGLGEGIRLLGDIPEGDLPALYGGASVFVFPSRCEGFGLPPLEAMACGTPVVVSNASSLPEVVGEAALRVDPEDAAGIAAAIERLLSSRALREEMAGRGLERAGVFSWERVAEETLALYESAVSA
jgi:glycosyltransferase involved in cell wall biosynthesis